MKTFTWTAGVLAIAILCIASGCTSPGEPRGPLARPAGTELLSVAMPEDAMYLFDRRAFAGDVTQLDQVTSKPAGQLLPLGGRADSMTSLRWNLPPSVLVIFYEDAAGKGNQVAVWGRGQVDSVSKWKFNDKVSRWAWYYLGDAANAPPNIRNGLTPRPPTAQPTSLLAAGTLELFRDRDLHGSMLSLGPIGTVPAGQMQSTRGESDQMSSLRWSLPPGVVVVFYEDATGRGRQLPIWGSGQYESVSAWKLNDKVSCWAWFDLTQR